MSLLAVLGAKGQWEQTHSCPGQKSQILLQLSKLSTHSFEEPEEKVTVTSFVHSQVTRVTFSLDILVATDQTSNSTQVLRLVDPA